MKILVISDTHGHVEKAAKLLPILTDLDLIVHLGDFMRDAVRLQSLTDIKVLSVGGNCDGVLSKVEGMVTLSTPCGPVLLTHGHLHGVKNGMDRLLFQAEELGAKAVLFGHTHSPYYEVIGGIALINPGSLTHPDKSGTLIHHYGQPNENNGTYGILNIDETGINCSIVQYREPVPKTKTPPSDSGSGQKNPRNKNHPGGFLRGLMNHSDRF